MGRGDIPLEFARATACRVSTTITEQILATTQRMKAIEKNLKATVIIQHDPRDIGKLPTFPAAAK